MDASQRAAAGATMDTLLRAYVRALDETPRVPVFSVWRYAALFEELLRWELAFLALIFVTPLLDLIRLLLRRFGVDYGRSPTMLVYIPADHRHELSHREAAHPVGRWRI